MGLEIYSANKSHSLPYSGFWRLRKAIASLCPKDMNDHYCEFADNFRDIIGDEEWLAAYNAETESLYQKYKKQYGKVFDFLYAPDCDARLTYGAAKQLLKVIGDYDDDHIYGYAGWGDKAMRFKDFVEILEDAVESKKKWGWY